MSKKNLNLDKVIQNDIIQTITELRKKELLRDEHGISVRQLGKSSYNISFNEKSDANNILFNQKISASSIMEYLLREQQYTILLYDKSIFQGEFLIHEGRLTKERLLFIKKHNKIWNKKEIDDAENEDQDWFANEDGVPVFLRIDYDPDNHNEYDDHPACHLSLSNANECRIPIKGAITFSEFVRFILFHFYKIKLDIPQYRLQDSSITELESRMIHINWE